MLGSADVASAGGDRVRFLAGFEPAWPEAHAVGPALTVRGAPNDNLALHHAIDAVAPGEVIVFDAQNARDTGHCGDLLALFAKTRGAAGLVVNGSIRDRLTIAELGFPVFHRGTSPMKAAKDVPGELRVPVLGVEPGDLVVADADGVVVVPAAHADEVAAAAEALLGRELEQRKRIAAGESTLDLHGLRNGA